ncbi:hypothetical protein [Hydrogenimonas sp.]
MDKRNEKEALLARLKKAYKKEKEKLEWVDNDFEASLIEEEMAKLKAALKEVKRALEALEGPNG